jgi:thioredoxin reductase
VLFRLSYAPLFIDKSVVVIGDEELALRSPGELSTVAREVTMVCANDKTLGTPSRLKLQQAGQCGS